MTRFNEVIGKLDQARLRKKLLVCLITLAVQPAWAEGVVQTENLGSVEAAGNGGYEQESHAQKVNSASHQAPSVAPLHVAQPTSRVSRSYIENNLISNANFEDTVKFTPSVYSITPSGSGLGKSEGLSIRGFQDGQYNVTFDGIPFGDASNFHHTTSAYFTSRDLGAVQVDRGPGTAATIGNATFGGTINLQSKDPSNEEYLNPYLTYGSYGTLSSGLEWNSGLFGDGTSKLFLDYQHTKSKGYLTNTPTRRNNLFLKGQTLVGDKTVVTYAYSDNSIKGYTAQGATQKMIDEKGPNFGLNDDPSTQGYYGYNWSNYSSTFGYINIDSDLGSGWRVKNTLYTNSFEHEYSKTTDPTSDNSKDNAVKYYIAPDYKSTLKTYAKDIPGKQSDAKFRAIGDVLRLYKDTDLGELQFGVWYDHNRDDRYSYSTDLTQGGIPVPAKSTGIPYQYLIHDTLTSIQPYAQFAWKITPEFTLTPGIKYDYFKRELDAPYNKTKPPAPVSYGAKYSDVLPSLVASYSIRKNWTAYAQAAKGFLAPPINVLEVTSVQKVEPEQTWNYQLGTAWQSQGLALGADVYYIDFKNYLAKKEFDTSSGTETTYVNGGGATYRGFETEATYHLGAGFNLYGNLAINNATYKDGGARVANTPRNVETLGLIYADTRGWHGSLMTKFYGSQFGSDNTTDSKGNLVFENKYPISSFRTTDLAVGYTIKHLGHWARDVSINMQVNNLFNNKGISGFADTQHSTDLPMYWTNPARSIFLDLSLKV